MNTKLLNSFEEVDAIKSYSMKFNLLFPDNIGVTFQEVFHGDISISSLLENKKMSIILDLCDNFNHLVKNFENDLKAYFGFYPMNNELYYKNHPYLERFYELKQFVNIFSLQYEKQKNTNLDTLASSYYDKHNDKIKEILITKLFDKNEQELLLLKLKEKDKKTAEKVQGIDVVFKESFVDIFKQYFNKVDFLLYNTVKSLLGEKDQDDDILNLLGDEIYNQINKKS